MFTLDVHDARVVLDWTAILIGIPVVIGSVEDLLRYPVFADDGMMSWRVARLGHRVTAGGASGAAADAVLAFPRYRFLLAARAVAMAGVWVPGLTPWVRAVLFLFVAATLVADMVRCTYGHSGAQQMMVCVCAALGLANAAPDGHVVQHVCLGFIALQATLAYVTSGWAKLASAPWRSGEGLLGIMGTGFYGHPAVHRLLVRRPWLAPLASWGTILFESSFFLVFLFGKIEVTLAFVAVAALFHLTVALVMGLNLFFWSFAATYPALLFCTGGSLR